jgi:hypothetical protein
MFERFDTPVQCEAGHLFTTIWWPSGSFKAVRFGERRYQRCPVGHHWAYVTPLDANDVVPTPAELAQAARVHDIRIP